MNKKDERIVQENFLKVYSGLLLASSSFAEGPKEHIAYELSCPEFKELKEKYPVEQNAGKGSDFTKAVKLVKWLAPELAHDGYFGLKQSGVKMDAASLLDYSFGKPENGINCACKAKILEECCLSLNIFARVVGLYPASAYDADNHVVTEIYDRKMKKWIMIDPTSGGYFVDERKTPLSVLELRESFANGEQVFFAYVKQSLNNLNSLYEKNFSQNVYFAKNLYYFSLSSASTFGSRGETYYVIPQGMDLAAVKQKNADYLLKQADAQNWGNEVVRGLLKNKEYCGKAEFKVVHLRTMVEEPDWKQLLNFNLADLLKSE